MKNKVLVTGGAGFIGSFIVDELVKKGYEVIVFDNLEPQVHPGGSTSGNGKIPSYLNKNIQFVKGDVRDYEAFKKVILESNIIIHMAAAVGVGQSQYEIKRYVDVNIGGTGNLLDILVNNKNKVQKIVVAASMSSYGEGNYKCPNCGTVRPALRTEKQMRALLWEPPCPLCKGAITPMPTDEDAIQFCNSVYSITKQTQEQMVLNFGETYDMSCTALRFFNVYGPRQSLSNPYNGVLAIFMSRIKNNRSPVIYEDGLQTRDLISVHDAVGAVMLAIENEQVHPRPSAMGGIFNVGSGNPMRIIDIARIPAKLLCGKEIQPEITQRGRKGDVRHCFAGLTKIKTMLGFAPKVSFKDGVKELIEWARDAESIDYFDKAVKELREKNLLYE